MRQRWNASGTSGTVMRAMGLFGGLQMFTILCGVVRVKCVALLLGTAGVGLLSIFNSALTLLSTATQLGLRTSAVREIATHRDSRLRWHMVTTVRFWGWALAALGASVTLVTAPLFSYYTFGNLADTGSFALLAIAVALMSATMAEQAVMQGTERLKALAKSSVWGVGGGLLLSLPLLYFMRMYSILPVLLAYAVAGYAGVWVYRTKSAGESRVPVLLSSSATLAGTLRARWRDGSPMLRLGGYMTVAAVLNEVINYIFIACLTRLGGEETVGIYQSGYTIIMRYVGMVFAAIGVEYYPRLAANNAYPARQQVFVAHEIMLLMAVLAPVLLVFVPLAPLAVRLLYSSEFLDAVPYMIFAVPGTVLRGFSWSIAFVMVARGDGRLYLITEAVSALLGLALNIAGYHYGGIAGLGIASTVWYVSYSLMVAWVYKSHYGYRLPRRVLLAFGLALAVVTLACTLAVI